jgi:nanoRNase/pAp phosphatase (c-di-AMP/oligoRNAs hydrolase)
MNVASVKEVIDKIESYLIKKSIMDVDDRYYIFAQIPVQDLKFDEVINNYRVIPGSPTMEIIKYIGENLKTFGNKVACLTMQSKTTLDANGKRLPENHELIVYVEGLPCHLVEWGCHGNDKFIRIQTSQSLYENIRSSS